MNRFLKRVAPAALAVLIVGPSIVLPARAADGAMSSSQSRMATCSTQNKGKKGDEFKKAQSDCLKGDDVAAGPMTQQQKMAMCSKQNKGRKGDDYKHAQSECLKG